MSDISSEQAPNPSVGADAAAEEMDAMDVLRILRKAGGSLLVHSTLHGQLIRLEWAQEKDRLQKMLMLTLLGFSCLICALLALGALALLLSWATPYRIYVLIGMLAVYCSATVACWWHFERLSAESANTFAATRAEIEADLTILRNSL